MANISQQTTSEQTPNTIIVDKVLTMEDVEALNNGKNPTVILKNTVGQSAQVIAALSPKVSIHIIGGYNGSKKPKYNEHRIQKRTIYSPTEVASVITKFEEYEQGIDPTWNNLEKAVYMYKKLAENIRYEDASGTLGDKRRNLNAILGQGVCAGYSIVFKEAMDRLGIECDIINKPRVHTWNAIKFGDTWYPLDLTWDASYIQNKGIDSLPWFGQLPDFNKIKDHDAQGENFEVTGMFNSKLIAEALNKVCGTQKYKPIEQKDQTAELYLKAEESATLSSSTENIMTGVRELAERAFELKGRYSESAYCKEFDRAFSGIFGSVKLSENLSDEQKTTLLKSINNSWADVVGCSFETLRYDADLNVRSAVNRIVIMSKNNLSRQELSDTIDAQIQKVKDMCTSYGVLDYSKYAEMASVVQAQAKEVRSATEQGQEVIDAESKIKIDGPVEVVSVEPATEFDYVKWANCQLDETNSVIAGIKESGADMQNPETAAILDMCNNSIKTLTNNINAEANQTAATTPTDNAPLTL